MSSDKLKVIESDERYIKGKSCIRENKLEEAVEIFGKWLEELTKEGAVDELDLAPVYYEYGNALLHLAETSADVFGDEIEKAKQKAVAELVSSLTGAEQQQQEEPPATDLQLAWEMLEVARVIYSRFPSQLVDERMARVSMRLGDAGMEAGMFSQARSDYQRSLVLYEKIQGKLNAMADLHCHMAMCCVYESSEDTTLLTKGLEHYIEAGKMMGKIIHEQSKSYGQEIQDLMAQAIPISTGGKARQAELKLMGQVTTIQEKLSSAQAKDVLESLDIYLELKEKAQGLKETKLPEQVPTATTKIGFENKENGSTGSAAASTPVVNVVPVRKKQKKE